MKLLFTPALALLLCSCAHTPSSGDLANTSGNTASGSLVNVPERNYTLLATSVCEQTRLSKQFDLRIELKRYSDTRVHYDSCRLKVLVTDKRTNAILDSISFSTLSYFKNTFSNCDNVISFSTHLNERRPVIDNYFGDMVVADLNFDGKDDIAITKEFGWANRPNYYYYLQGKERKFVLDSFLTDAVSYFPIKIDPIKKTLTGYKPLSAGGSAEYFFTFNPATNNWTQTQGKIFTTKFDF